MTNKPLTALSYAELVDQVQALTAKVAELEVREIVIQQKHTADLDKKLEANPTELELHTQRERLIASIVAQFRSSWNLMDILETAVAEVRNFLQCDRVTIGQQQPDGTAIVMAESIAPGQIPCRHQPIDRLSLSTYWRKGEGEILWVRDAAALDPQDFRLQLLPQIPLQAQVIVPILDGDKLWGFMNAVETSQTRDWSVEDISLLRQLSIQLATTIHQATTYQQIQNELIEKRHTQAVIQRLNAKLEADVAKRTQAWQESEAKYRLIVETAQEGICILDLQSHIRFVNQQLASMVGQASEQIVGRSIFEFLEREQQPVAALRLQLVAKGRQEKFDMQVQCLDGSVRWVIVNCTVMRDARNQVVGILAMLTDISDRKKVEEELNVFNQKLQETNAELARATQLKDEFLANMSHELRTPLNAILGMAEGLKDEVWGSVNLQQQKSLTTIERSGRHLLELINDILDLSKIEAGKLELQQSNVSVQHLCESSLSFVRQLANNKNIRLMADIEAGLGSIWIDELRVRQLLINLLNNAVKFTPNGGSVILQVYIEKISDSEDTDRQSLCLAVQDSGIGIAPHEQAKLFQSFVQLDSSLSRKHEGTGLGLAMVRRIAELHGGKVTLASQVGLGSCFTVYLPYVPMESDISFVTFDDCDSMDRLQSVPGRMTNFPLILVAEDRQANFDTISDYLESRGYRLLQARNGLEALDMARTRSPSLILMDVQMPDMDGLSVIQHIRQEPELTATPIVALTALALPGDLEKYLTAGANLYLSKPVRLRQLGETIKQLLSVGIGN